ncbi:MAG: hypothetical protein MK074_04345 [Phycisphaerales bacterium]|nr:hypothetical protein [Phycisphaerales bacterium]
MSMRLLPTAMLLMLLTCPPATGQGIVLLDQIGAADASDINTFAMLQHQIHVLDDNSPWNTAVLDQFSNPDGASLTQVSIVIGGHSGYSGVDAIAGMRLAVFSSTDAAEQGGLVGDVVNDDIYGPLSADPDWPLAGIRDRVMISGGPWACDPGDHWIALIPINEFAANGVTTQTASWIGDGSCVQVNPAGLNGWTQQEVGVNAAITVIGGTCALPLPETCTGDVTGPDGPNGIVDVNDLLLVIGHFGYVGENGDRPQGDCAPLPMGDCEVDVDDLLLVISQFNSDCRPRGACCMGLDGCTSDMLADACEALGGLWMGEDTSCDACVFGACCRADLSCEETLESDCMALGEVFWGQGIACDVVTCELVQGACCVSTEECVYTSIPTCDGFKGVFMGPAVPCDDALCGAVNDTCLTAVGLEEGANPFDTSNANDSNFGDPDETQCPGTYLNWEDSPDVWFYWYADNDALVTLSTCQIDSYDTSMVVYQGDACSSLEQIACNGDGTGQVECQGYYSRIADLPVAAGTVIWVRIGGYDGAVGPGTLTMDVNYGVTEGACCVDGTCIGQFTQFDCMAQGGVWVSPQPCEAIECPGIVSPCQTDIGADPVNPSDDWISGTSDTGQNLMRAQAVDAASVQVITVYGLSLSFDGAWAPCDDPAGLFDVRTWLDDGTGQPGEQTFFADDVQATLAFTGTVYPTALGNYPLMSWTIEVNSDQPAQWLSVQSNALDDDDCLFLWMSSTEELMGYSLLNEGSGWEDVTFGLNYCIEE